MNKQTQPPIPGSVNEKGMFTAKNPYNIYQSQHLLFEKEHPQLLTYTPSNVLVTDEEHVEVVGPVWQYQSKGGVNENKWFCIEDYIYENTYKGSIYNTRQVYVKILTTEKKIMPTCTDSGKYCMQKYSEYCNDCTKPIPEAQPLEGVKTAQSILSATGKTISTITHIELLQCMEEYANYRIAQFETGTRHHLTDEELLKAMQDYHKESIAVKDLDFILNMSDDVGKAGCTYNDTEYDSLSAAYGSNETLHYIQERLSKIIDTAPSTHSSSEMVEVEKVCAILWEEMKYNPSLYIAISDKIRSL